MVHLFTACMDPRSRPLRELGLHTAESVGEALGDPKRAPEMATRLVGSGCVHPIIRVLLILDGSPHLQKSICGQHQIPRHRSSV